MEDKKESGTQSVFVHFLGAAETVTGSKYLVDTPELKFMVDCGLFQGLKKLRELNWAHLPINASEIQYILLTHGHLDHVGFLPRIIKMGFKGKILGTQPTLDIASIILKDSAYIQEEEAELANQGGYSKHRPAKPLYTVKDVEHTLGFFKPVEEGEWIPLSKHVEARFKRVGHIIGATFIEMNIFDKRFVFSGDVGRPADLLMHAPKKPREADVLFIESTYGGKRHSTEPADERLAHLIKQTLAKGGSIIIPSFAVERSQTLMYILWKLVEQHRIPQVPMIMDSPMGADVLNAFRYHLDWHKLEARDCVQMCAQFHVVQDYAETLTWINDPQPKIVLAGSGMVNGGRVLSYLRDYISRPETTVILIGFQSEGTRGRRLMEGAEEIKIYGAYYDVRARIEQINSLSAHADEPELLDWLADIRETPERVFIVHGERGAADAFRLKLQDTKGWPVSIPALFSIVEIPVNIPAPNDHPSEPKGGMIA